MHSIDRGDLTQLVASIYRSESRRVLATLIRVLGDFDLAEEALHDAFRAAVEQWPRLGIPDNPRAWLVSAGRFKTIDRLRQHARFDAAQMEIAERLHPPEEDFTETLDDELQDDRLRLIFTCCHPALPREAQVALTLREVCGLTTEEIARAFLTSAPTLAQRIVRAKNKIKIAKIPYAVPGKDALPERMDAVLQVIYLVFNEGYAASSGDSLIRVELCDEAIRLARLLVQLLPEPEAIGLLALMLLHQSRRAARTSATGELILLDAQDRALWDRDLMAQARALVRSALQSRRFGPYTLQAAIAAVHSEAQRASETDWLQIVGLYDVLLRVEPTPIVELNRAVAVGMRDGPQAGLPLVQALLARGELKDYHLAHAAEAHFCRRLGQLEAARAAYRRALELAKLEPERRFLAQRLAELEH